MNVNSQIDIAANNVIGMKYAVGLELTKKLFRCFKCVGSSMIQLGPKTIASYRLPKNQ